MAATDRPHPDPFHSCNMTPEARLDELASILAEGLLRLRERSALMTPNSTVPPGADSERDGLEVSAETPLHGRRG
jgi:hypothetical protein